MFPSRDQWSRWSLPSKLTAIGAYLAVIGLAVSIVGVWVSTRPPFPERGLRPDTLVRHDTIVRSETLHVVYHFVPMDSVLPHSVPVSVASGPALTPKGVAVATLLSPREGDTLRTSRVDVYLTDTLVQLTVSFSCAGATDLFDLAPPPDRPILTLRTLVPLPAGEPCLVGISGFNAHGLMVAPAWGTHAVHTVVAPRVTPDTGFNNRQAWRR